MQDSLVNKPYRRHVVPVVRIVYLLKYPITIAMHAIVVYRQWLLLLEYKLFVVSALKYLSSMKILQISNNLWSKQSSYIQCIGLVLHQRKLYISL